MLLGDVTESIDHTTLPRGGASTDTSGRTRPWSFALDLLLPSFHDMTTVVHKCEVRENNAQ